MKDLRGTLSNTRYRCYKLTLDTCLGYFITKSGNQSIAPCYPLCNVFIKSILMKAWGKFDEFKEPEIMIIVKRLFARLLSKKFVDFGI